jgi:hypothetical protein
LASQRWRRPGWKLLVVVFVALPMTTVWLGEPLLFSVFGSGAYIPVDSAGYALTRWWNEGGGQMITVGVVALLVLLARRVFPLLAMALAGGAGALTVAWWFISLFVYVAVTGASVN